jgi:protein SCO1/2
MMGATRRQLLALGMGAALSRPWALAEAQVPTTGEAPLTGIGGDIRLTDQHGQSFVLSKQPAQPTLLFFGFTQCARVCPQALGLMQALAERQGPRQPPRMVFVTLDPLSDTPAALKAYLAHFDARIVGLTGSPTEVTDVARRYGVRTRTADGVLDHSARLYLLGPHHEISRVHGLNVPLAQLAKDILAVQSPSMSFNLR